MSNLFIPVALLLVLPTCCLAWRVGWLRTPERQRAAVFLSAAAILATLPWDGTDLTSQKRISLLLATATAALFVLAWRRVAWTRKRHRFDAILAGLAVLAGLNYVQYFQFHGERTFVQLHDVAHYYLGAKYYDELGYTGLYTGLLRAEAENHDNHFRTVEARDLETYERVHIRTLLQRSEPVKNAFSSQRWTAFRRDADYFRDALESNYGRILIDHGFNPTPVWALIGGALAQTVTPGDGRGILLLCLFDPLLLLLAFAAVAWAFGRRAMLVTVIHFAVLFGANFAWTGGAFLRHLWFAALLLAICSWHRRRYATSGVFLALAAGLRVFPIFFAFPLLCRAGWSLWRRRDSPNRQRRLPRRYQRFLMGLGGAGLGLFLLTATLPQGLGHWLDFSDNMRRHLANISPNVVGVTEVLAFSWEGEREVTQEEFNTFKARRSRIKQWQQLLLALPFGLWVAWSSRKRRDLEALLLAIPLLLMALSLAAYYLVFMILLTVIKERRPGALALLFATEAVAYGLTLYTDWDALSFVFRTVSVLWLCVFLLILRRDPRQWMPGERDGHGHKARVNDAN